MSITDELRETAARTEGANGRCLKLYRGDLDHIADRIDEELSERYVMLPKDADGVPYRIGDKVDSDHYEDGTVIGINYFKALNGRVCEEIAVQPNGWDVATWRDPEEYTHHHAPTVEDVLTEFGIDWEHEDNCEDRAALLAEYAAKLQLREVDE